jgi:hypothetical protein
VYRLFGRRQNVRLAFATRVENGTATATGAIAGMREKRSSIINATISRSMRSCCGSTSFERNAAIRCGTR